jgi:hypothetical protein
MNGPTSSWISRDPLRSFELFADPFLRLNTLLFLEELLDAWFIFGVSGKNFGGKLSGFKSTSRRESGISFPENDQRKMF